MSADYPDDDDLTPEQRRTKGRHSGGRGEPERLPLPPPLPPPPAPGRRQRQAIAPPVAEGDAVPRPVRGEITDRIDLATELATQRAVARVTMSPVHVDRSDLRKILLATAVSAVLAGLLSAAGWWLSVHDGLQERPTRDEMRQAVEPIKAEVRAVERALDRLTGAIEAKGKAP